MKLSLEWLSRYVEHGLSPEDLAVRLTMAGLEVEDTARVGGDTVFTIEVTPNRPDCLSLLGLAREVSAIVDRDLSVPVVNDRDDSGTIDISIASAHDCARYIGTVIDGVRLAPSPADTSRLLTALGLNPVSNIVDITNFVLFESGQPLHAFDLDRLSGGRIEVRRARQGEKIVTLDDVERTLDENILVIADAQKPVAIAGIMGGRDTAVSASTRRILLESASFDQALVRRASRRLGLTSDSCYRFERGVAWAGVETAAARAVDLILDCAGGAVAARRDVVARRPEYQRMEITVTQADIQDLLGAPLDLMRARQILRRLGCVVAPGERSLAVVPPAFRQDLRIKQDVVEEVARVIGYDNLPMTLPQVPAVNIAVDRDRDGFNDRVAATLVGLGYQDVVTYALLGSAALDKTNYRGEVVRLKNPMSAEQELMRPTALPGLLAVAAGNIRRGQKDLKLFEVGKRYFSGGERWTLSLLASGRLPHDWRVPARRSIDVFDIKGALEAALAVERVAGLGFVPQEDPALEPGQAAGVTLHGTLAGRLGRVAAAVLERFEIKKVPVVFAEIDLESALEAVVPRARYGEPPAFPAMTRDLSLAVRDVSLDALRAVCRESGGSLLSKIDFVELYTGDKMEAGWKGYVLSLTYQSLERTLTDEEVNRLHESIARRLDETLGTKRR